MNLKYLYIPLIIVISLVVTIIKKLFGMQSDNDKNHS